MNVSPNWNPYSRADWTELQQRFRPPPDGPSVSTRLRDYATAEEIDTVVAALQQVRRELSVRARGANRTVTRRMSAAAQDAALAAMWAAADGRRIGWILGYLRKCIVHRDYRDYAGLLRRVPQGVYSRSSMPGTSSRGRPRSKIYVKRGPRLQSMMPLGRVTCAGWRCVTFDGAANGCFRTKGDCRRRNSIG
jgi:hypothetical protein